MGWFRQQAFSWKGVTLLPPAFAELLWHPSLPALSSHSMPSSGNHNPQGSEEHFSCGTLLPCCHTLSLIVCHSSFGRCSWTASQAAAVPQKHLCQHKYSTVLGNSQPRAFCTLKIYPDSKSSVGKLEMIVSKGTNLSYFTPPLTSRLICFYKSTSQYFRSHIPVSLESVMVLFQR